MNKRASLLVACCLVVALVATGCGNAKVTGKVYFSDGTTLLKVGTVNFTDDKILCKGEINRETGVFEMRTVKPGDGVPPGTYKVYITETLEFGAGTEARTGDAAYVRIGASKNLIDPKYSNPDQSGLTVTVSKSMTYDITLDAPAPVASAE